MSEDVQLVQLSKSNIAVTFNKKALAAMREGGSSAIVVKFAGKELKLLFMRDVDFQQRMGEFRRTQLDEIANISWLKRWFVLPFQRGVGKISPIGKFRKVQ